METFYNIDIEATETFKMIGITRYDLIQKTLKNPYKKCYIQYHLATIGDKKIKLK